MTTYEIVSAIISICALIISIWAIVANKRNSTENDSILFHKIEKVLEPIFLYEKDSGFEFDKKYLDLCGLLDFTREFDNYHFSKGNVEKIWTKLKKQIINFRETSANTLLANSEPTTYDPNIIESYVYFWQKKYSGIVMPEHLQTRSKELTEKYPEILKQLQALLKTYATLCIKYKKS